MVRVMVQDSGAGIDPELKDRLFESFATSKPDGMGMGLSISRAIVEDHAGKIWAASNEEGGTTFVFTMPGDCEYASDTSERHDPAPARRAYERMIDEDEHARHSMVINEPLDHLEDR
jgi:hypothetical protein